MTRSIFFYQKLGKGCPISCAKFQHDPPHSSGCIAEKPQGGGLHQPPLHGRGLNILEITAPSSAIIHRARQCHWPDRQTTHSSSLSFNSFITIVPLGLSIIKAVRALSSLPAECRYGSTYVRWSYIRTKRAIIRAPGGFWHTEERPWPYRHACHIHR